ncbi:MAG: hypothetical protein V1769_00295 [Thermoplasmatota archaeon]
MIVGTYKSIFSSNSLNSVSSSILHLSSVYLGAAQDIVLVFLPRNVADADCFHPARDPRQRFLDYGYQLLLDLYYPAIILSVLS